MGFICHETIGGTALPRGASVKFVFGLGIGEVKGGMHYLVLFISQAILSMTTLATTSTRAQRRPGRRTRPVKTRAAIKKDVVTTMTWIE